MLDGPPRARGDSLARRRWPNWSKCSMSDVPMHECISEDSQTNQVEAVLARESVRRESRPPISRCCVDRTRWEIPRASKPMGRCDPFPILPYSQPIVYAVPQFDGEGGKHAVEAAPARRGAPRSACGNPPRSRGNGLLYGSWWQFLQRRPFTCSDRQSPLSLEYAAKHGLV